MADITTIRAKIKVALDEQVRLVNLASLSLQSKIQAALDEADAVINPTPTPVVSSTITFTEGTPARVSVAGLMPSGADRYHGGWEVQVNGFPNTDNHDFNWLPGVYFDPATQEMVYDGSPMSLNTQGGVLHS